MDYFCYTLEPQLEKEIQNRMNAFIVARNGAVTGIVNQEFLITVYSTAVPDLELVDLPGITTGTTGNDAHDFPAQSRSLTLGYVRDKNTMVLAILPFAPGGNVFRTNLLWTEILNPVTFPDVRDRTIAVVTKIDCDRDAVIEVFFLGNPQKLPSPPMKKGFLGLFNGSPREMQKNFRAKTEDEENLVQNIANVIEIDSNQRLTGKEKFGIAALIRKIQNGFLEHVKESIPMAKNELTRLDATVKAKIQELGKEITPSNFIDFKRDLLGLVQSEFADFALYNYESSWSDITIPSYSSNAQEDFKARAAFERTLYSGTIAQNYFTNAVKNVFTGIFGRILQPANEANPIPPLENGSSWNLKLLPKLFNYLCERISSDITKSGLLHPYLATVFQPRIVVEVERGIRESHLRSDLCPSSGILLSFLKQYLYEIFTDNHTVELVNSIIYGIDFTQLDANNRQDLTQILRMIKKSKKELVKIESRLGTNI